MRKKIFEFPIMLCKNKSDIEPLFLLNLKSLFFRTIDIEKLFKYKQKKYQSYLSIVNAIIVRIETQLTSSDITIAKSHPTSPNGIGQLRQKSNISIGITDKEKNKTLDYKIYIQSYDVSYISFKYEIKRNKISIYTSFKMVYKMELKILHQRPSRGKEIMT